MSRQLELGSEDTKQIHDEIWPKFIYDVIARDTGMSPPSVAVKLPVTRNTKTGTG